MRQPEGTRIVLMQSLLVNRKGEHKDLIDSARSAGFARLRIDGELVAIEDITVLDKRNKHTVEAVIDRLVVRGSAGTNNGKRGASLEPWARRHDR